MSFVKSNALGSFLTKHGVTLKTYQICLLVRRFEFGMIRFQRLVEKNVVIKIAKHFFLPLTTYFGSFIRSYLKLIKMKLKAVHLGPIYKRFFSDDMELACFVYKSWLVTNQTNSYGFDQISH